MWNVSVLKDMGSAVKDTKRILIDDNAYRYGGLTSRAYRNAIKEKRLTGFKRNDDGSYAKEKVEENPEAGANVVLHKDSKWKETWNKFKDDNPIAQTVLSMRRKYEESDNPVVNAARFVSDRFRDMFGDALDESEHAYTIAEIKEQDPTFELEVFMKDAREFIIPEFLEATVHWNPKTLKEWSSEAVFSQLQAGRDPLVQQGLSIEGNLLDLRNVDLVMARMMEDIPVLVLAFKAQQIEVVKNLKGEIVAGSPDKICNAYYVAALTKDFEKPNPLTQGWKIIEWQLGHVQEGV